MTRDHKSARDLQDLLREACPLAGRAADVRSANVIGMLRDAALERQDLKQEVLIGIWVALPKFDPARAGLNTYVEAVTTTTIASICRRGHAAKRVKPADYKPREYLHLFMQVELRLDIDRVLSRLAPRERQIARLLMEDNPTQIARRLKISRAAVYRSIGRIRAVLREGGLGR